MKYLTLIFFVLLSTTGTAQVSASLNYVKIDYDAAGNRIKRSFIVQDQTDVLLGDSQKGKPVISTIKAYPNPVADLLTIEIDNKVEQSLSAKLIDINGKLIHTYALSDGINSINLNDLNPGEYIVSVIINGKNKTWKLTKL